MSEWMFYGGIVLMLIGSGSIGYLLWGDLEGTSGRTLNETKRMMYYAYGVMVVGVALGVIGGIR